jgi:hypothetical protein
MDGVVGLFRDARVKLVLLLVGLGVAIGLTWWGYSFYRRSMNEKAQLALALPLEQFEKLAAEKQTAAASWEALAQEFETAYQEHRSSDLAPFFLTFEADSLVRAGKTDAAVTLLDTALAAMGSSNPLYYLYKIKLAILTQNKALMQELAADVHNPHRGYALYELWHQAWVAEDREVADQAYAKLMGLPDKRWAMFVQSQLAFAA